MDFNVNLFLQYTIIGLATGSLIALIALGYTLVYGIIELINFAHGEVFMMGAFFAATFIALTGATAESGGVAIFGILLLALIGSMLFSAGINFGIDRVGYQRLRNAPRLATLIAAIGFSFILQNIGIYWMGSNPFRPPEIIPLDIRSMNILTEWFGMDTSVRFRVLDLFVIGVTVPLLIGLSWFVYKTRVGTAMRATAQDREAASLMGINVNWTIGVAFLLGGALAGAAGMVALYYNDNARFQMGFRYGLFAFTAVVGGFLIGLAWSFSDGFVKLYVPAWGPQWTTTLIFGLLILVLVFRPSGLLGEETTDKV
jgi:branched-chain amino acid transport system permease protein